MSPEPARPAELVRGRVLGKGVTRTAYRVGRWAVKVPNRGWLLRGWLANQSEWKQRHREDANGPVATLFHVALAARIADQLRDPQDDQWHLDRNAAGYDDEESKPQSWGLFDGRWLLLDFDRAWRQPRRWLLCRAYYWNQEHLARKWMRLPRRDESVLQVATSSGPTSSNLGVGPDIIRDTEA